MVQARLVRIVLALLAIGLVTCNGSMELDTATYELGVLPIPLKAILNIVLPSTE